MGSKSESMSMADICEEALKHIDPVIKDWPQSSSTNDFHQLTLLIKTKLIKGNYELETLNSVVEKIFVRIAKEILEKIAEENKIEERAVKVRTLIAELNATFDKIMDTDIDKIRKTRELLHALKQLVTEEVELKAADQKIEQELRRIVQKV